jgi:hypothetical protein
MVLERKIADPHLAPEPDAGLDLRDVRVDVLASERLGDGDAVVAVAYEVQVPDPVQGDRRQRLAAALGGGDPLPAAAQARRGGAEAAIEVRRAVDRADDRVQRHDLQPDVLPAGDAERVHNLLEREYQRDIARLAAQAAADVGQQARAPRAREVTLSVGAGEAGRHDSPL